MDRIIVYFDDAAYARHQLAPMQAGDGPTAQSGRPTEWVLVACAPRMTQRIGKWSSHGARESWREKWAAKQFEQIVPDLRAGGSEVSTALAKGPLPAVTMKLLAEYPGARVLDARRPKFGEQMQPVVAGQPTRNDGRWEVPVAVAGMGAVLVLAAE